MHTATDTATEPSKFETKNCTRCGGSGHYSYCYSHGTTCFKCGGRGWIYTARGQAAATFFADSLKVAAEDVTPGTLIRTEGIAGIEASRWLRVESVEVDHIGCWSITKDEDGNEVRTPQTSTMLRGQVRQSGRTWNDPTNDYAYGVGGGMLVRVAQTNEAKAEKLAAALAYQETLTAKGEPRKRGVAA